MRGNLLIAVVAVVGLIVCGVVTAISSSIRLDLGSRQGVQGWEAGFAEYSPEMEGMMLEAGIRALPCEVAVNGPGYYLRSINHSDDLSMFLRRRLGTNDGVVASQDTVSCSPQSLLQIL